MTTLNVEAGGVGPILPAGAEKPINETNKAVAEALRKGSETSSTKINKSVKRGWPKIPWLTSTLKTIKNSLKEIFSKDEKTGKLLAVIKLTEGVHKIASGVAKGCQFIHMVVGTGAAQLVQWVPVLNIVGFFVNFLSLGLAAKSIKQSKELLDSFDAALADISSKENKEQLEAIDKALNIVETLGIEPLREQLILSNKGATALLAKIKQLNESALPKEQQTKEKKELIRSLSGRVEKQVGLEMLKVVGIIGGIVGAILVFIPAPGAAVVGFTFIAVSGAAALVSIGTKKLLINKNPFNIESKCKALQLIDKIGRAIKGLRLWLQKRLEKPNASTAT